MTDRVPTYVNTKRLCFELSISEATLDRWMADGRIPPPVPGSTGKTPAPSREPHLGKHLGRRLTHQQRAAGETEFGSRVGVARFCNGLDRGGAHEQVRAARCRELDHGRQFSMVGFSRHLHVAL